MGGVFGHQVITSKGIVFTSVISPDQSCRDSRQSRQRDISRGKELAITAFLVEQEFIDRIRPSRQIVLGITDLLIAEEIRQGIESALALFRTGHDACGDLPYTFGDLLRQGQIKTPIDQVLDLKISAGVTDLLYTVWVVKRGP